MRVRLDLDDPRLFEAGRAVVLELKERRLASEIEWFRPQHGRWVAKFRGVDSIAAAETWVGAAVSIEAAALPEAPEGSFFSFDLEGCDLYDRGRRIGRVSKVLEYGSAPLLAVEGEGGEILVPFADAYLKRVDTAGRRIDVELPEGLIGLNL